MSSDLINLQFFQSDCIESLVEKSIILFFTFNSIDTNSVSDVYLGFCTKLHKISN